MEFKVKTNRLKSTSQEINISAKGLKNAESQISSVAKRLDIGTSTDTIVARLKGINTDLQFLDAATRDIKSALGSIALQYILTEIAVKNQSITVLDPEVIKKIQEAAEKTNKTISDSIRKGDDNSNAKGGDPVNLDTGNYIYENNDLTICGIAPFSFTRFYNSMGHSKSSLGDGWLHNYEIRLSVDIDSATIVLNDGREELFVRNADGYAPLSAGTAMLNEVDDRYVYTKLDGSLYWFDRSGRFIRAEDANGNGYSLEYTDERLIRINKDGGEYFELDYYETNNLLHHVTDHTGRRVEYIYNDARLTETRIGERTITYGYDNCGRLTDITNPRGVRILHNEYDGNNRAISQSYPDSTSVSFEYENSDATILKEKNGAESYHFHDELFRNTVNVYPSGTEENRFDEKNQLVFYRDFNGNETHFTYDNRGNISKAVMADGAVFTMTYEKHNKPVSIAVNGVRKQKNVYDEKGNLLETTDAIGRTTSFKYNNKGIITEIRNPGGGITEITYDDRYNITSVKEENGATTLYTYDDLNRVICAVDGEGNRKLFEYDRYNNLVSFTNASGAVQTYKYNEIDEVTEITGFNGGKTVLSYNELGKVDKQVDPLERVTSFRYDRMWNKESCMLPNGGVIHYEYDETNRLSSVTDALGNTAQYEYDGNDNIVTTIDPEGAITTMEYDTLDNLVRKTDPEGNVTTYEYNRDKLTCIIAANESRTEYEYDEAGQLITERNALGETIEYKYTADGDICRKTDEAGRITSYEYACKGKPSRIVYPDGTEERFTYDYNGNITSKSNGRDDIVTFTYDKEGRVVYISNGIDGDLSFEYDPAGNLISFTDGNGNITEYEYSLTDKLTAVTNADGGRTEYEYNEMDLLDVMKQLGDGKVCRTQYIRDKKGNIIEAIDSMGFSETFKYSARGELIERTDKEGYVTKYSHDRNGDLRSILFDDGREAVFVYDPLRKVKEILDWTGRILIDRDILGRVTKVTYPDTRTALYTYGKGNSLDTFIYPNGRTINYEYDEALHLKKIREGDSGIAYHFNELGLLATKVHSSGLKTEYSYDIKGRLAGLRNSVNEETLDHYLIKYDAAGNKKSVFKNRKGIPEDNGLFEYDYDSMNRLVNVCVNGERKRSYTYDQFGNRTSSIKDGRETGYLYNEMNQLTEVIHPDAGSELFRYDRRGNLIGRNRDGSSILSYHYGAMNRLEGATSGKNRVRYEYNGLGLRTEKRILSEQDAEQRVYYTVDFTRAYNNMLEMHTDGNEEVFIWDGTITAAKCMVNGVEHSYALDDMESPVRLVDKSGESLAVCGYDEYGLPVGDNEGMLRLQPLGYIGFSPDPVAGTYFAQAREYMPEAGRFTARDAENVINRMEPASLNLYVYCDSNPVTYYDLTGFKKYKVGKWPHGETVELVDPGEYKKNTNKGKSLDEIAAEESVDNAKDELDEKFAEKLDAKDIRDKVNVAKDIDNAVQDYKKELDKINNNTDYTPEQRAARKQIALDNLLAGLAAIAFDATTDYSVSVSDLLDYYLDGGVLIDGMTIREYQDKYPERYADDPTSKRNLSEQNKRRHMCLT